MVNQEIARIFDRMAKVLAFKGADRFRILAYERGAASLRDLKQDLREQPKESFAEIPAIGEDLSAMISEYLAKGRISKYEKERRGIPDDLIDLMTIPGLGPKTLATLHKALKVRSLEDLKRVLGDGAIRTLPGFGEKKIANLRKSVDVWTGGQERMPLGVALPLAEELLRSIRKNSLVERADLGGSLRRARETIGDIDILIVSDKSPQALSQISRLPQVRQVTALGDTLLSMEIEGGIHVDLRALPKESYGAALQYFTGSKEHNVHLRTLGRNLGLKLNEYGVFRGETRVGGAREEDVYKAVGLPMIPPEMRENRGEIEAAERNALPDLVTQDDLRGDLHVHTTYSDGRDTLEAMVERAAELGYEYVAFSDHSPAQHIAHGLELDRLHQKLEEIRRLRARRLGRKPYILAGAEVDILPDGTLDYPEKILNDLDVVVAAIHSAFQQPSDQTTGRILDALDHRLHVLAHPTARLMGTRAPLSFQFEKVLEKAAKKRIALEVNGAYLRLDLNDTMARAAGEARCLLSIGSDAHSRAQLEDIRYGVLQARRGWLTAASIVNTWSFAKISRWLERDGA